MTVGQVLAKIAAGEAPAQSAGQDSGDPKQEDAAAGAAPADSTAVDTETQKDSGLPTTDFSQPGRVKMIGLARRLRCMSLP